MCFWKLYLSIINTITCMCHDSGQAGVETIYSKRWKDRVDRIIGDIVTPGSLVEG
jgi:hypothetical protein